MREISNLILNEIEKELLNRPFLKTSQLTRKTIVDVIGDESFRYKLMDMIEKKDFHCQTIFELLSPLFPLSSGKTKEEWLRYFYHYALSLSFPEAVSVTLDEASNSRAQVYLHVLKVISNFQRKGDDGTWQSQYPIELLSEQEIDQLEDKTEYLLFKKYYVSEYVYEMMKLNQEVIGFTTLDHICGVHHIAMKTARQLKAMGYPIDLGRVSGAAIGHDFGKFGCKKDEMSRVAYYHYFYTGEWFEKRDIVYIRNVAINHSTWDLELDALPIESLILIYSDFRVKADKVNGVHQMLYFNLKDSFDVILNKLDNLDEAKESR